MLPGTLNQAAFEREKRILMLTQFFFGLSYALRYIFDQFLATYFTDKMKEEGKTQNYAMTMLYDLVCYSEGLSFMALLLVHRKNFKPKNAPVVKGKMQSKELVSDLTSQIEAETCVLIS